MSGTSADIKSPNGVATVAGALDRAAGELRRAGLPEARRDARLLVALAAGIAAETVIGHPDRQLEQAAMDRLDGFLARRSRLEPISRIAGRREFWSLSFEITPDTLDPRPDSETLIEAALDRLPNRQAPLTLLDLGTGTGCLLLALLAEFPRARGVGIDISPEAVAVARRNAVALGFADRSGFLVGDWSAPLGDGFDLVVANPPYIPTRDIASLPPEVVDFDPRLALAGGADGLDAYRALVADLPRLLRPGGVILLEVGAGQATAVREILAWAGFENTAIFTDLAGIERCVVAA